MSSVEFEDVTLTLTTQELATFRMTFGDDFRIGAPAFRHFATDWGRVFEHAFWKLGPRPRESARVGEPSHPVTISLPRRALPAVHAAAIVAGMRSEDLLVALGMELVALQAFASNV